MGGGIGNFVSNMAAATAGSVIGHTIAHGVLGLGHAVGGGSKDVDAAAAPAAPHGAAGNAVAGDRASAFGQPESNAAANNSAAFQDNSALMFAPLDKASPCYAQHLAFRTCVENSDGDMARCNWAADLFKQCRVEKKESSVRL